MGEWDAAVAAAEQAAGEDEEPEQVPAPDFTELPTQILGGRAREAMAEGNAVPDEILVDLVIAKIRTLKGRGYVLDGFPATVEQAKLLEQKLAGVHDVHVHPAPQPPPSRLAPVPPEDEIAAEALPSALCLHVRLHVDKEISLRRRVGRLVDPEDAQNVNASFHLEFDPPPEDDTALCARLVKAPDPDNADLLTRISSYSDERALLTSWLSRFGGILAPIDATDVIETVFDSVNAAVEQRILALTPPEPEPEPKAEPEEETVEVELPAEGEEGEEGVEAAGGEAAVEEEEVEMPPKPFAPVEVFTTHCNTLRHTATHCNTLRHTATHCNTLRHTATHCNTLQHTATHFSNWVCYSSTCSATLSLPHTATHCNTLQHTATHCNTLQHAAKYFSNWMCDSGRCSATISLQHTATRCNNAMNLMILMRGFEQVHVDVANMLLEQWEGSEAQFELNMRRLLRAVRDDHRKAVNWVALTRNGCVAACCSMLQCAAVCCSVLQCDAVRCSVLQCIAVTTSGRM